MKLETATKRYLDEIIRKYHRSILGDKEIPNENIDERTKILIGFLKTARELERCQSGSSMNTSALAYNTTTGCHLDNQLNRGLIMSTKENSMMTLDEILEEKNRRFKESYQKEMYDLSYSFYRDRYDKESSGEYTLAEEVYQKEYEVSDEEFLEYCEEEEIPLKYALENRDEIESAIQLRDDIKSDLYDIYISYSRDDD